MIRTLLFQLQMPLDSLFQQYLQNELNSQCSFLSEEWEASTVSIAITFVVFIMGIPALIFQTFISDAYRNIYNERFKQQWWFFIVQLVLIMSILVVSNPHCTQYITRSDPVMYEKYLAYFIIISLLIILTMGHIYLWKNFVSAQDIEQKLTSKIANDAFRHYQKGLSKKLKKDIEALVVLAKGIPAGTKKNSFLEECENNLLEKLLREPVQKRDTKLIGEILKDIICLSVIYDKEKSNTENVMKVMGLLNLTFKQAYRNGDGNTENNSYLKKTISNCMKDIGIKAMRNDDHYLALDAVEKLSVIDSTFNEMYALGSDALHHNNITTVVAAVRKLGSKARQTISPDAILSDTDKRNFFCWLGLVAKVHKSELNAQRKFARWQLEGMIAPFQGEQMKEIQILISEAQRYFYQLADFEACDAVGSIESNLFVGKI